MNKALKVRIYKYLSHTGHRSRYMDVLPEFVASHNNARHSKLAPYFTTDEADMKENEVPMREIHRRNYHEIMWSVARARTRHWFKKAQLVRITLAMGAEGWSGEQGPSSQTSSLLWCRAAVACRFPRPTLRTASRLQL